MRICRKRALQTLQLWDAFVVRDGLLRVQRQQGAREVSLSRSGLHGARRCVLLSSSIPNVMARSSKKGRGAEEQVSANCYNSGAATAADGHRAAVAMHSNSLRLKPPFPHGCVKLTSTKGGWGYELRSSRNSRVALSKEVMGASVTSSGSAQQVHWDGNDADLCQLVRQEGGVAGVAQPARDRHLLCSIQASAAWSSTPQDTCSCHTCLRGLCWHPAAMCAPRGSPAAC